MMGTSRAYKGRYVGRYVGILPSIARRLNGRSSIPYQQLQDEEIEELLGRDRQRSVPGSGFHLHEIELELERLPRHSNALSLPNMAVLHLFKRISLGSILKNIKHSYERFMMLLAERADMSAAVSHSHVLGSSFYPGKPRTKDFMQLWTEYLQQRGRWDGERFVLDM